MGAFSCALWFLGFAVLIDWIVFSTFPVWGRDRQALYGATLKLIASVLFCIQPMSALSGYQAPFGAPWSNFVGICFFHGGNTINAVGMLKLYDGHATSWLANVPTVAMCVYFLATCFLVVADGIFYFSLPDPSPGYDVGNASRFVHPGQVVGASLLLLGSVLYCVWAVYFGRAADAKPLSGGLLEDVS